MDQQITKEYCYYCRVQTNQEELLNTISNHESSKVFQNPEYEIWFSTHTSYKVRKCMGCEHISLNRWQYTSEREEGWSQADCFPPRTYKDKPQWHGNLELKYQDMLSEIYTGLANSTNRITLMGCRTIIDMYLNDKVGDIGGVKQKLSKLYKDNGISEDNKETLLAAIEAGDAASHRAYSPDEDNLISVVRIIENLLEQLVLKEKANLIAAKTPARRQD